MTIRDAALFKALLTKRGWNSHSPNVVGHIYTSVPLKQLYALVQEIHERTTSDLTLPELRAFLPDVDVNGELAPLLDTIEAAESMSPDVLDEAVRQFAARQLSYKAAERIVTTHTHADFNPAEAFALMEQAMEARLQGGTTSGLMGFEDVGLPDLANDRPGMVPLRLHPQIDKALGGGVAAGEMVVMLAGAKRGKTSLLSRIGAQAALAGQRVLHLPLENSVALTQRRYDSAVTGLNYAELLVNPQQVAEARPRMGDRVRWIDWQYKRKRPWEIVPLVQEWDPDLIILDYMALMQPNRPTKGMSKYEFFGAVAQDVRAMAKQVNKPVVTAWQVTRAGMAADQVQDTDLADCIDVLRHANAVIGISRTQEEMSNHVLRLHTLVQHFSEQRVSVRFRADLERNQLEEI